MSEQRPFLTAKWANLLLLNYGVDPALLAPELPKGCEFDLLSGKALVSLVGFEFLKTKVWGMSWPFFTQFPEINLRFYVKHKGKRGVCFIREYVPSRMIAGVARWFYNEPYRCVGLSREIYRKDGHLRVGYAARDGKKSLRFGAVADDKPYLPVEKTLEHFFKEHDLGVGKNKRGELITYQVKHARWRVYPIQEHAIEMSPGLFGPKFDFLSTRKPDSIVLAEGSEVSVYRGVVSPPA
jgi:hypothetical protein